MNARLSRLRRARVAVREACVLGAAAAVLSVAVPGCSPPHATTSEAQDRVANRPKYPAHWWTAVPEAGARAAWRYCDILMQIRDELRRTR